MKGSISIRILFILLGVIPLFLLSTIIVSSQQEEPPNVDYPEFHENENILFAGICSSNEAFLTDYQEIDCRDIWIISFRKSESIQNQTFFFEVNNQTYVRTALFDYDSQPDRSWLRLDIPLMENRTKIQLYVEKKVSANATLKEGYTLFNKTPKSELPQDITAGELLVQFTGLTILLLFTINIGRNVSFWIKKRSPMLDYPSILVNIAFMVGGMYLAYAIFIVFDGFSIFVLTICTLVLTLMYGIKYYTPETEKLQLIKINTESQSIEQEIFDVRKLTETTYELLLGGLYAISTLFGRKHLIRSVAPIRNWWASVFENTTFFESMEIREEKGQVHIEYLPQELEITQQVTEANRYLHSRELHAKMYKKTKDQYNNLLSSIDRYADYLVSSRLYQIHSLLPSDDISKSHQSILTEIQDFKPVEDWTLREEIQKEDSTSIEEQITEQEEKIEQEEKENESGQNNNRNNRFKLPFRNKE